jgi:endonuclease/exonuclease/phosphatase family metal-dependent hydrolase
MLAGSAGAEERPAARPIRVVTLNVLHGGVWSGWRGDGQHLDTRLALAAAALRQLRPDVVALQEASRGRGRGDVAGRLARSLGMSHVYVPGAVGFFGSRWLHARVADLMNFEEGPAILSRFRIQRSGEYALPPCGRRFEPRALLFAELATPRGPVTVFSTHTAGDACHTRAVAELVARHRRETPAVVMGDFNAVESSPPIQALTGDAGFVDAFRAANPDDPGYTVWQPVTEPERRVRRRVDYVFLVPGRAFAGEVLASRVVVDRPGRLPDGSPIWPSDHFGVLADLVLFPPAGAHARVPGHPAAAAVSAPAAAR